MKRTKIEIEKKINELVNDEKNFTKIDIYNDGGFDIIFDSCETRKTLENFIKWLNKDNEHE